jgi:hypothetical protein
MAFANIAADPIVLGVAQSYPNNIGAGRRPNGFIQLFGGAPGKGSVHQPAFRGRRSPEGSPSPDLAFV